MVVSGSASRKRSRAGDGDSHQQKSDSKKGRTVAHAQQKWHEPTETVEQLERAAQASCSALRDVVTAVHTARGKAGDGSLPRETTMAGLLVLSELKRVTRASHRNWLTASTGTADERAALDSQYLQLQNILYEKSHIDKEIRHCEQFRSRHLDIGLDENVPAGGENDDHKAMLLRLQSELAERTRLQEHHEALLAEKEDIEKANAEKEVRLKQLPGFLNAVITAAKPVADYFEIEGSCSTEASNPATFLPNPLYVLFTCLEDHRKISGGYAVSVVGDRKAARDVATIRLWEEVPAGEQSDEMNVDDEDNGRERRGGQAVEQSAEDACEEQRQRALSKHPLRVKVDFDGADAGKLSIEFAYLLGLRVVTVTTTHCSVPGNILDFLYPDDTGDEMPSEAPALKMEKLGMKPFAEFVEETGRAYKWAQIIAGVASCHKDAATVDARLRRTSMMQVMQDIKAHLKAHVSLADQLESLSKLTINVDHKQEKGLFPLNTSSKLTQWSKQSSTSSTSTFRAVLSRGKTQLYATVEINMVYPLVAPHFSIEGAPSSDFDKDCNLRAIESEVNIHFDELTTKGDADMLLTLQMRRLQMCFDILCEVDVQESAGKLFERGIRYENPQAAFSLLL